MSNSEKMVLQALKDKAPDLHKELMESGKLKGFVRERAEEIAALTTTLAHQMADKQGYAKTEDPMERARIMNGVLPMAREVVLAEQLEFPQDETSPQSQDRTTDSATMT